MTEASSRRAPAVYVLGMHRSGTSALAHVIDQLGLYGGPPDEFIAADEFNPQGYWEQGQVVRLHDKILRGMGGWASAPLPIGAAEATNAQLAELVTVIDTLYGSERPFYVKDPRHCLLLEPWFETRGSDDVAVLIVRSPTAVSNSLQRRNRYRGELAEALWLRYTLGALRSLAGRRCHLLRYEQLVSDTESEVNAMADFVRSSVGDFELHHATDIRSAVESISGPASSKDRPTRYRASEAVFDFVADHVGSNDALPPVEVNMPEDAEAVLARRRRRLAPLRPLAARAPVSSIGGIQLR